MIHTSYFLRELSEVRIFFIYSSKPKEDDNNDNDENLEDKSDTRTRIRSRPGVVDEVLPHVHAHNVLVPLGQLGGVDNTYDQLT